MSEFKGYQVQYTSPITKLEENSPIKYGGLVYQNGLKTLYKYHPELKGVALGAVHSTDADNALRQGYITPNQYNQAYEDYLSGLADKYSILPKETNIKQNPTQILNEKVSLVSDTMLPEDVQPYRAMPANNDTNLENYNKEWTNRTWARRPIIGDNWFERGVDYVRRTREENPGFDFLGYMIPGVSQGFSLMNLYDDYNSPEGLSWWNTLDFLNVGVPGLKLLGKGVRKVFNPRIGLNQFLREYPGQLSAQQLEYLKSPRSKKLEILNDRANNFYLTEIKPQLQGHTEFLSKHTEFPDVIDVPESIFFKNLNTSFGKRSNLPIVFKSNTIKEMLHGNFWKGLHYHDTGINYIDPTLITRSIPRIVPFKLIKWYDKIAKTPIKKQISRYRFPDINQDASIAIHEVSSHGTDDFIRSIYKNAEIFNPYERFSKDFSHKIRKLSRKKSISFTMPEVRATINEFKAKFPDWRNMTFDEFINNIDKYKELGIYAKDHLKLMKDTPGGYRYLYDLIQNPQVF